MNQTKLNQVKQILHDMQRVIVAYSGGVDSTLLAYLAHTELGANALAVTLVSPSLPHADLRQAQEIAHQFGFAHETLQSHELDNANYLSNTPQRCYFCKQDTYRLLQETAHRRGFQHIANGANLDDAGDYRPGHKAGLEAGVRSPFLEAGLSKRQIRELASALGLPNWDKPAAACLASRIPYGTPITIQRLAQVEQAEGVLHSLGFRQLRVRAHDSIARIELAPDEFALALDHRRQIVSQLKALGFAFVALDLAGYQTGSLNQLIETNHEL
ncbi:MAG: ATP-dependent sacrificial sulfur transferase LarE [Chloroflexota bacterium]